MASRFGEHEFLGTFQEQGIHGTCQEQGSKLSLTCTDVFSKFAWVVLFKNKAGVSLVNSFQLISDLSRSPDKPQTDKGTEFLNKFQSLLKENGIHFFTTKSELKASVVECFNRTLETRMWKYFTAKNTHVYNNILQDIMQLCNNSSHRRIGRAPASVRLLNVRQARRKYSGNHGQNLEES